MRRWAAAGAVAAAAAVVLLLLASSFADNRRLVLSTGELVAGAAATLQAGEGRQAPLEALEPLRQRYLLLEEHAQGGPPWSMRLGLYRGAALLPPVRSFYAEAARRLLIDAAFREDVEELERFVKRLEGSDAAPDRADHAQHYELLRLHLLLTQPRGPSEPPLGPEEQAWVGRTIARRWSARALSDPTSPELVERNAAAYARLLAANTSLALPRYQELVRRSRRILSRLPLSTLAVQKLAADLSGKDYDVTLTKVLANTPVPALRSTAKVPGAFTRRAYDEVVKGLLANPAALVETWVVAGDAADGAARAEAEAGRLRSQYFARYIEEWKRFIDELHVGGGLQALPVLQDLTHGVPPPHALLFRAVGYNTRIGGAGLAKKLREGGLKKLEELLGSGGAGAAPAPPGARKLGQREDLRLEAADVESYFAPFAAFGQAPDGDGAGAPGGPAKLPVDAYLEQLSFVREALKAKAEGGDLKDVRDRVLQARARVQALLEAQPIGWRPAFQNLLLPPVEGALAEVGDDTALTAARQWCSAVVTPFRQSLEGRYPFAAGGDDAPLAEVGEFFRPVSGILWGFYDKVLRAAVQPSGDGFEMAAQAGGNGLRPELAQYLGRAQVITKALYPAGAAEPRVRFSVQVKPTPRIASVTLVVNGQEYSFVNGPPDWHAFAWPGDGKGAGASLRARAIDGQEETLQRDGEWGFFRLLETGVLQGQPSPGKFTLGFKLASLGKTIAIDFRADQGSTPFVATGQPSRLLEPLRVASLPVEIGRKGGACR